MVWPRTIAASVARASRRILPSSISLRPPGGEAQPASTWSVITAVRVAGAPPVETARAEVRPFSLMKARTTLSVEEPAVEYAMVWPLRSLRDLIGEATFTYQ